MSDTEPTPPPDVPKDITAKLERCSSDTLRTIATYAASLAEHRARERNGTEEGIKNAGEEESDLPTDVPSKATVTIKEINENRYYYWQWRDGDEIKSKYKGPVEPDE